jgi:predicted ATP-binding protein involved in virulence
MNVTKLHAENVHGYLPIDVEFFPDLTFLTGLNGSGKTSALRLLMALLTPNLDELGSISFSHAAVTIKDGFSEIIVTAEKDSESLILSISSLKGKEFKISHSDLERYIEAKKHDEPYSLRFEKLQSDKTFQHIKSISTPMFLGLDRRFYAPGTLSEDIYEIRRRDYLGRRPRQEELSFRATTDAALVEVDNLVAKRMQEVRTSQEALDERLRLQFFTKAFEYNANSLTGITSFPSRLELTKYRNQLNKIEQAAEGLKIPLSEIQIALTHFFEHMSRIVDSLEKSSEEKRIPEKSSRTPKTKLPLPDRDFVEWIVNKPQVDRILEHLRQLEEYIENRDALRDPITRFLSLINKFLAQTQKEVTVANTGHLTVKIVGSNEQRPISALSSGERQLLVILAHLSLNPNLSGSSVFIVDEPELSLHIDWQEKFVDAIQEANPKVQLILATHSPAIILDRTESCLTLNTVQHD